MTVQGKVALVTGASRGIGRDIALAFAHAGADVACVATSADNAADTMDAVRRTGQRACAIGADVAQGDAVAAMMGRAVDELGRVDILVNNAGISMAKPTLELEEADWDRVAGINEKSVFLCSRDFARHLQQRGAGGVIVNIGSIAGINAFPKRLSYCGTKAAVHHMTRVLAAEWAELGIRVNAVAPGYIRTDLVSDLAGRGVLELNALEGRIPQRQLGEGADIAAATVFLAGDEARYITGAVLPVDGGWIAYGHV